MKHIIVGFIAWIIFPVLWWAGVAYTLWNQHWYTLMWMWMPVDRACFTVMTLFFWGILTWIAYITSRMNW